MFRILSSFSDSLDVEAPNHLFQFPFVWWNRWRFFSLVEVAYEETIYFGFHLSCRTGGGYLDIILLCIIMTTFWGNKTFLLTKKNNYDGKKHMENLMDHGGCVGWVEWSCSKEYVMEEHLWIVKYPSHYENYVFIVELLGIMCRRKTGTSIGLIISYGSSDREY